MYGPGAGGFVDYRKRKSLAKYRRLPFFNRATGEKEYRARKLAHKIFRRDQFNKFFNYPTNNNRTRSLSKRSFARQTADLKQSQYFIDQYRGGLQDNHRLKRTRIPWSSDLDILSYQARNILNKEAAEKTQPIRDFFDDLVKTRSTDGQAKN